MSLTTPRLKRNKMFASLCGVLPFLPPLFPGRLAQFCAVGPYQCACLMLWSEKKKESLEIVGVFPGSSKCRFVLDGPNRQSPIASVQRMRSTLAGLSAIFTWNEYHTNDRQSRKLSPSATNAGSARTNFCVLRERYDT